MNTLFVNLSSPIPLHTLLIVSTKFKEKYKVYRTGAGLAILVIVEKSDTRSYGQLVDDDNDDVLIEAFAQCKDSNATARNIKNLKLILTATGRCKARSNLKKNLPATVSTTINVNTAPYPYFFICILFVSSLSSSPK
jgi:bifunctional N-acetylglucosamine-1-phosphate-uridyltransferase/glucosamine-1-phosphate-acetyltransferase GlmU-like protein